MSVIDESAAERKRQIECEDWSFEHDDEHTDQSLAMAGACYALPRQASFVVYHQDAEDEGERGRFHTFDPWPWFNEYHRYSDMPPAMIPAWDKRDEHDRRRCLVIAGALILAEIERIDRAASSVCKAPED